MRLTACLAAIAFAATLAPAGAEDIDAETLKAIHAVATKGFKDPATAEIKDVRKSKAANGLGYCGMVTIEDMPDAMTTFHAILEGDGTVASILRLADFPSPDYSANAALVHQLMKNFGCIE